MPISFFPTDPTAAHAIGAYNDALTRDAVARVQADAAVQQAQIQAQAQQRAMQQQAQQNQFLNALKQQELQQQGAYQRGALENDSNRYKAMMDQARMTSEANARESAADRISREKIAGMGLEAKMPSDASIQAENNAASAHADRLNFSLKSLLDAQAADEKAAQDEYAKGMAEFSPFTLDSTYAARRDKSLKDVRDRYRTQISQLVSAIKSEDPVSFDQAQMRFVPKLVANPKNAASGNQFFGGLAVPSIPETGGFQGGMTLDAGAQPSPRQFFGGSALGGGGATPDRGSALVTVRSSTGKVGQMKSSDFATAKQRDPGLEIYTPGQTVAPRAVPPPAETVPVNPGNTPGSAQTDPSIVGMDRLQKLLSGAHGAIDIGKSPFMQMFGWSSRDLPAIRATLQIAESGKPLKDMFGNMIQLSPQQIAEAKQILSTLP